MKTISRNKIIYTYGARHKPVEHVRPNETFAMMTEDAFGGQIKTEKDTVEGLDWSKIDGATGPVFVMTAKPGDTLVVEILDIRTESKGVIVTVPKSGILGEKPFGPLTKTMKLRRGFVQFEKNVKLRTRPMIGTIGVTPKEAEVSTGSLGKHGGNMARALVSSSTYLCLSKVPCSRLGTCMLFKLMAKCVFRLLKLRALSL